MIHLETKVIFTSNGIDPKTKIKLRNKNRRLIMSANERLAKKLKGKQIGQMHPLQIKFHNYFKRIRKLYRIPDKHQSSIVGSRS